MIHDDDDEDGPGVWFDLETQLYEHTEYEMTNDDVHDRANLIGMWLRDIDCLFGNIDIFEA